MNPEERTRANAQVTSAKVMAEPKPTRRIGFVDGMRGVAMLLVLGFHHWQFTGFAHWQVGQFTIPNPFAYGYLGVHLFLVISGFCLAWPYSGPQGKTLEQLILKSFLTRRFIRLAPAYYVILLLSAVPVMAAALVKTGTISAHIWWDLGAHLLWVHNLSGDYLGGFNMAMWSLALEFQLYLLFPVFLFLRERFGLLGLCLPVVLGQLLYRHAVEPWTASTDWAMNFSIAYALPGRMVEFVAGIAVATLVRRQDAEAREDSGRVGTLLAGTMTLSGGAAWYLIKTQGMLQPAADMLWGVFFASSLGLGFVLVRWRKMLEARWLVKCGICAYSVYLIHHPVGLWLSYHFYDDEAFPLWLRLLVMGCYPLLMIGAGWVCYRLLEEPLLRRGRS